ncbi:11761_t:CDS:2, partial [Diversispora eburnea]
MAHHIISRYSEFNISGNSSNSSGEGGILTYCYKWKILNWNDVKPFTEYASPPFIADGLQWVFKVLSLYLGILETSPGCLIGIRKKVAIIFVLENLKTRGIDYGKLELPVWFCAKHSTWGEETLISLDEMDRFISNNTVSLCVKFEIQESIIDGPPEIPNPFNKLVNSSKFSDIKFQVIDEYGRDKIYYGHKGILASSSPVFEAMLTNGMKETFEDKIQIYQVNHNAFLTLLTFIYTFKIIIKSLCEAENLLSLSDRFDIVPVRKECLRYFRMEINVDNVWGIWAIAEKYSCTKTSTTCRDFVALYLDILLEKESTLQADPNILRLALENDEVNVHNEEKIYELVVKW